MSLHEKLRLYLADKHATFSPEGVSWTDDEGAHLLVAIEGTLSAGDIVDAHVRAQMAGAKLHIAHVGSANPVAHRTATRFGVTLLCEADLPSTAPASADDAMPWHAAPLPESSESPSPVPTAATVELHADPMPWHAPAAPRAPVAPPAVASAPELVLARSEAPLEIAHADDAMPWGGEDREPEAPALVHVDPVEMLAVPWLHELDDDVEELPAGRETRSGPAFRPTQSPSLPGNPSWGLPWPRPVVPTDGLAIADPKIWNTPGRLTQMREDLDRIGAPSFGAAKPEGSAWLKRVSEYGPL